MKLTPIFLLVVTLISCSGKSDTSEGAKDHETEQLGTVRFPNSCNSAAASHVKRGIALLHHMTYSDAEKSFKAALEADPDCAIAYWGIAMSFIHPLWADVPDEATLQRGLDLVNEAKIRGEKTGREQAYIGALEAYYRDGKQRDERARLLSFDQGWRVV